jgi:ABC-type polysaccharide/polyol phosphate export permease
MEITWIRRFHRGVAVAFTLTVVATVVALARENPIEWMSYVPLLPLALLFLTGIYLFLLPYLRKRR